MAEYGITPDYIVNNWTDELLNLMLEKMVERKERMSKPNTVSPESLASRSRGMIKVVKNGN